MSQRSYLYKLYVAKESEFPDQIKSGGGGLCILFDKSRVMWSCVVIPKTFAMSVLHII